MAPKKTVRITYAKPGTRPPIYVAGSFSSPAWQPQEMQYTTNEQGEHAFTKEVEVEEGKEYQYKFRIGESDWWLLNEDEPSATDDAGNRNNLLMLPITPTVPVTRTVEVEKTDSEATDAHNHTKAGYVVVRSESRTPEVAAEVADAAMLLDREVPTPPMSDEEAGRTGYRRMSYTPIPEVANTAAEVADSAAILDKDNMVQMPLIHTEFDDDRPDTPDSGASTPPEDKVPLFAHECIQPPPGGFERPSQTRREPVKSKLSIQESAFDFDDPSLEEFPTERNAILERVRTLESRLPEDQTNIEGIPPSPVVGANHNPDRMELLAPSPGLLAQRSPSLKSIPEEGSREEIFQSLPEETNVNLNNGELHVSKVDNEEMELPVKVETPVEPAVSVEPEAPTETEAPVQSDVIKPKVDVQEVPETPPANLTASLETPTSSDSLAMDGAYMEPEPTKLPTPPFVFDSNKQLGEQVQKAKEVVIPEEGPQITVQPATPGSSLKTTATDPFNKQIDTAKATAIEEENGRSALKSRKPASPSPERPLTPTSMRSAGKDAKSRNFLKAFWRVIFVEWIGGFIMRLRGGDRHKA